MDLTKTELEQILNEVTKEFQELVKSEKLSKADMEKSAMPMEKEESSKEETKPEAPKAEDSMPEATSDKDVTKAEGDMPPAVDPVPEVPTEAAPAEDAMVADQDASPDQLLSLYSGLSPEHLAQHWMAASQALFQSMSAEQAPEAPAPVDAQPAPAVPPDAPDASVPSMMKSEDTAEYKKLQKNFSDLKSQNDALEKSLETLSDKLNSVLKTPVKLGVTPEDAFVKSEVVEQPLSKSEILSALKEKSKDPKLTKDERAKVLEYSFNPVHTAELKQFLGIK